MLEIAISKVLGSAALSAAGNAVTKPIKELLAEWDNDTQVQKAIAEDRALVLGILRQVAIGVARSVSGQELSNEHALLVLFHLATDLATRRRLRALLNEAGTSTDERVAMLAVGYFVGGQEPSMRERLDWAIRELFPADADALGLIVELNDALTSGEHLLVIEQHGESGLGYELIRGVNGEPLGRETHRVSADSLRALESARCVALVDWLAGRGPVLLDKGIPAGPPKTRVLTVLPLGRELHRILSTIDWREIARRRNSAPAADAG